MPSFCYQNRAHADIGKRDLIDDNNNNNNNLSSDRVSREDY
jgi:hypothetical protein